MQSSNVFSKCDYVAAWLWNLNAKVTHNQKQNFENKIIFKRTVSLYVSQLIFILQKLSKLFEDFSKTVFQSPVSKNSLK